MGFKLVALTVALVLWFNVKTDRPAEVRYPVPLEIVPESDEETILRGQPESVNVLFAGTGKDLLRLGDQRFRVRKVLAPGKPGPRRVILDAASVSQTGNLDVRPISVEPSVITLTVDRVGSKRVPLRSLSVLEAAEGYELQGRVRFDPPEVTLIGARTFLAEIDTIAVDLTQFRGRRESIREAIAVRLPRYPTVIVQPDSIRIVASLEESAHEAPVEAQEGPEAEPRPSPSSTKAPRRKPS